MILCIFLPPEGDFTLCEAPLPSTTNFATTSSPTTPSSATITTSDSTIVATTAMDARTSGSVTSTLSFIASEDKSSSSLVPIIAGAVGGGAVLIALIALLVVVRGTRNFCLADIIQVKKPKLEASDTVELDSSKENYVAIFSPPNQITHDNLVKENQNDTSMQQKIKRKYEIDYKEIVFKEPLGEGVNNNRSS